MKALIALCVFTLIGCANSDKYVDLANCRVKAAATKAAIKAEHPEIPVMIVPGTMRGESHVEVKAFINGEWLWAYWVRFDFKSDIIDFYPVVPRGFREGP